MTSLAAPPAPVVVGRPQSRTVIIHLCALGVLVGAAMTATWTVWAGIFRYAARNEEQAHSFLAVPLAAWLVWVQRTRLTGLWPTWGPEGPVLMVFGWILTSAGFRGGIGAALHLGSWMMVVGGAYTAVGRRVFLRVLPAIGALALALPVPGRVRLAVGAPLQEWSARITQFVLDTCALPVQRTGNVLTINGVEVAIAEACNGMRMVSALAVISYAFVFSIPLRPLVRVAILVMSPVVALAVNVLRLVPAALMYGYATRETADRFHDIGGWGVLVLAIGLLSGFVALLRWLEVPVDAPNSNGRTLCNADGGCVRDRQGALAWALPLTALLLCGAIMLLGGFDGRRDPGVDAYHARIRSAIAGIPYRIGNAVGIDQQVSPGVAQILRPNAVIQRHYSDPSTGVQFGLMVIHCGDVRDLLDHYPPVCYPSHGWTASATQRRTFGSDPTAARARVYEFTRRGESGTEVARIVSFFVLPRDAGGIVDTMEAVAAAARLTQMTTLGAAHIMVAFSGDSGDDEIAAVMGSVLEQLAPIIRTTARGTMDE